MSAKRVEWVLLVWFNITAHRAVYGRLPGTLYSKDFIQLSSKTDFIQDLEAAFPALTGEGEKAQISFQWPNGSAPGMVVKKSADRPHLAWTTNNAPPPWKMSNHPSAVTAETIRGDPTHKNETLADSEFEKLTASGFGQPFLLAVKLEGEEGKLHLRVHIANPEPEFEWADLQKAPSDIRELAASTSNNSALAWRFFPNSGDVSKLYFDASSKFDPWKNEGLPSGEQEDVVDPFTVDAGASQTSALDNDLTAESLDHSEEEVSEFEQQIEEGDYGVPDSTATVKTRGSAQKAFSAKVKNNYGWRCAVTGIETRAFLIASHIVPWSVDEAIRLDPANGICLSVLIDRAFEHGYLVIQDDLTINVDWERVGDDKKLVEQLGPFDDAKLDAPKAHPPKIEYLSRRRDIQLLSKK